MLLKKIGLLTSAAALTTITLLSFQKTANADLVCFPWEDPEDCHPNYTPFSQEFYNVYLHNRTNRTIWVAVHFLTHDSYGSNWETEYWTTNKWYRMAPGEKARIFGQDTGQTDNRYIYFFAYDEQGNTWGGSDYYEIVDGEERGFFKKDMGSEIGDYTQRFVD